MPLALSRASLSDHGQTERFDIEEIWLVWFQKRSTILHKPAVARETTTNLADSKAQVDIDPGLSQEVVEGETSDQASWANQRPKRKEDRVDVGDCLLFGSGHQTDPPWTPPSGKSVPRCELGSCQGRNSGGVNEDAEYEQQVKGTVEPADGTDSISPRRPEAPR